MKVLSQIFQFAALVIGTVACVLSEWGIASTMWTIAVFWLVKQNQYD